MHKGMWGTICDDGWDNTDSTIVCKELGYLNGNATTATRYVQIGPGPVPIWLSEIGCLGNESKLSQCIHKGFGNVGNCSHAQDVGVSCSANGMCPYYVTISKMIVILAIAMCHENNNFLLAIELRI